VTLRDHRVGVLAQLNLSNALSHWGDTLQPALTERLDVASSQPRHVGSIDTRRFCSCDTWWPRRVAEDHGDGNDEGRPAERPSNSPGGIEDQVMAPASSRIQRPNSSPSASPAAG
jgi:hypothetical protein